MGKIVVSSMISLDGYTEGVGGNVMAMPMDAAFGTHNADLVRGCSSLLFGGTTFRGMVQFWPGLLDNPDISVDDRYIAESYADGLPITVVSDTLTPPETAPWTEQTTIVTQAESHQAVANLRKEDGDALIFGSRTLWTDLLANGLIDELYIMIGAKVVAGEHHTFTGVPETNLRLLSAAQMKNSQNVLLHYTPA